MDLKLQRFTGTRCVRRIRYWNLFNFVFKNMLKDFESRCDLPLVRNPGWGNLVRGTNGMCTLARLGTTLFLLLCWCDGSALWGQTARQVPMTQIPHIAKFAQDPQVASHFARVAEFSIRLLQWKDTDRPSVIKTQRWLKSELYNQTPMGGRVKNPSLSKAIRMASDGYWSLESPRLLKIEVGEDIEVIQVPRELRLLRGKAYPLPVVLRNGGRVPVTATLQTAGGQPAQARSLRLQPGEAAGTYMTLHTDGKSEGAANLEVRANGRTELIPLEGSVVRAGRLKVRVLNEEDSVTPARIYLTGSDGRAYLPEEAQARVSNADYGQPYGGDYYFYSDGNFEVQLPPGTAALEVVKGFEYAPVSKQISISAGQSSAVEIQLQKPLDLRRQGWFSGDTHVHPNVYDDHLIRPADVLLIAKAEDLNLPQLLICNDVASHLNDRQYFQGRPHHLSEENYILYWNQEMRAGDVNNHVGYLGLKELVQPAFVGWPGTPLPYDYPPNYEMGLKAQAQGAVVTYVHPGLPSQYPIDIALGAAAMIDVVCQRNEDTNTDHWYQLLNCGFQCPISAGTDSFLNTPYHLIAGAGRVYVQVGPSLTYDGWIKGYREGRSFATNAPLLKFSVNGKGAGEEIHWGAGPLSLKVEAEAVSHVAMKRMDLIVNGQVAASQKAEEAGKLIRMTRDLQIADSAWVAVRVHGDPHKLITNDTALYAHSSPVYCYRGGRKIAFKKSAAFFIEQIDQLIHRVQTQAIFRDSTERDAMIQHFRKGQEVYRRIEAQAAR